MNKRSVFFWGSIVGWLQAVVALKVRSAVDSDLVCSEWYCIDDFLGFGLGLFVSWVMYRVAARFMSLIEDDFY